MTTPKRVSLIVAAIGLLTLLAGLFAGSSELWRPSAIIALLGLALGIGGFPSLKGFTFTVWILVAVAAGMIYPAAFSRWGGIDLRNKWLVLFVVQLVMFGMGTQMKLHDFAGVLKMPWGVFIAVACQFLVMPLSGWALTKLFPLPDEMAAGVILIGCCSSGLASNVMTYLAGGNLPLSITATAITTLLAPLMTPLWMKVLAGTLVEVRFTHMMLEIVKIVLVPIAAALLHDVLVTAAPTWRRQLLMVCALAAGWLALLLTGVVAGAPGSGTSLALELSGFVAGAFVVGLAYHLIVSRWAAVERSMPVFSMTGIIYFTTITTAAGRDNLMQVGLVLFLVAALHNGAGYFLGYWLSRLAGLDARSCRTVAFEVGLQNGGMASGLAGAMGKLATVGLAAAIFSPWMNISGSVLANYWKRRPVSNDP